MKKIIICALGAPANGYSAVKYKFNEEESLKTPYFVAALARSVKPDKVIVLVTPQAKQQNADLLTQELADLAITPEYEEIPNGEEERELWTIVQNIARHIPDEAEVTVDITYGFRSIPLILTSTIGYLRDARKNVRFVDALYGAFEAVPFNEPVKPVFSVKFFTTLLDWTNAVKAFKRTGDCILIADMLREHQINLYKEQEQSEETTRRGEITGRLIAVAERLTKISLALDMLRPLEIMDLAADVDSRLKEMIALVVAPFDELLEQIRLDFHLFALPQEEARKDLKQYLQKQQTLMRWYCERRRYYTACLLAREWVISWYMYVNQYGSQEDFFIYEAREKARSKLKNAYDQQYGANSLPSTVSNEPGVVAERVRRIRNGLAHAGNTSRKDTAEEQQRTMLEFQTTIEDIVEKLCTIGATL